MSDVTLALETIIKIASGPLSPAVWLVIIGLGVSAYREWRQT